MRTANRQDILTTGQVARICHVAPQTVSKWFDSGKLRGYRIPGSRERRIPRQELLDFMRAYGMPTECLEESLCEVLIIASHLDQELWQGLIAADKYQIHLAGNRFEAGVLAQQLRPHVVVLEAADLDDETAICRSIKSMPGLESTRVILAGDEHLGYLGQAGMFDDFLPRPYSFEQWVAAFERATALVT